MALRDDVLSRIDIVDLVWKYVELKKTWKNRSGLCPFHKEKTPSFSVAEDKQIFKCFGCGKWWNAITFHMEIERLDFWDSIQYLAKEVNVDIAQYQKDPEKSKQEKSEKEKVKLINSRLQNIFNNAFSWSKAEKYSLEKRKLTPETIKAFGLWYAPDSHYEVVTTLKDKGFTWTDLAKAWVARQWSSWDTYAFFRNRLTFPIHNHIWTIVWFGARALEAEQSPKYLNTTETPLYDKSRILYWLDKAKSKIKDHWALIIVEWYMDVIALHQYWLPIWIATCGTALTWEHVKLIKRNSETLIFAFDNDKAWFDATMRWLKMAYEQDLFPRVLTLPEWIKDIDEYLTNKWWTTTIDEIKVMTDDGFNAILKRLNAALDTSNPVERKKFQSTLFELLRSVQDYWIFMMYMEQLAVFLATSTQPLIKQYKQYISAKRIPSYNKKQGNAKPEVDHNLLVASLFYDDFLKKSKYISEVILKETERVKVLTWYLTDHMVHQVMNWTVDEEIKQKLLEHQLLRETQRWELPHDKVCRSIEWYLSKFVRDFKRVVLKHPGVGAEDKKVVMSV